MDLKLRFADQRLNDMRSSNRQYEDNTLDKYSRRLTQSENHPKSNLDNYIIKNKKSGHRKADINTHAPDNQFKRYLLDTKNVFYEERPQIHLMKKYNMMKWVSGLIFLMLFISYLVVGLVKPFQGKCPSNAKCGVFVNCFDGYEYNEERKMCELSGELLDQTENLAVTVIQRLKRQYGKQQCDSGDNDAYPPNANINEILSDIQQPELKTQLIQKLEQFLTNSEQQQKRGFRYHTSGKLLIPTEKLKTIGCQISQFLNSKGSFLKIIITLMVIIVPMMIISYFKKVMLARLLYKKLRQKTLNEKTINIGFAKEDLEKEHGMIDESLWRMIDEYRHRDRDIVFMQDDFLYWEAL